MEVLEYIQITQVGIEIVALLLGTPAAFVALWLHWKRTTTDRHRLANDTYVKAVDQLGSVEVGIRVGAVYALERIAIEDERYHWPIMETFCASVRERSPWSPIAESGDGNEVNSGADSGPGDMAGHPPTDIQAILTVIVRRSEKHRALEKRLDLSRTDLHDVDLEEGDFSGTSF